MNVACLGVEPTGQIFYENIIKVLKLPNYLIVYLKNKVD